MFVLQMRKQTQVEQRATLCAGEAGAEVSLLDSSPLPQGPCYLVQGGLRGQLQGHWFHGAAPSQDVLETLLGMGEGLWGLGQTPHSQAAPLKPPVPQIRSQPC